jgi:tetratricopeptide (TPR) repeat protein
MADYTKVIELKDLQPQMINHSSYKPLIYEAYYKRGSILGAMGEYTRTETDLTECINIDKTKDKAYINRGYYRIMAKNFASAVTDFNAAIYINATNPLAWNNRGLAYFYLKDYSKAESDCLQSLKYKSDNGDAYLNLGKIYLAQGKKITACENLVKASELQNKEAAILRDKECK